MRHIKIYIASKLRHAEKLKALIRNIEGFHFNSRWLDTGNLASNAAKPSAHWQVENFDDIQACDYIIGYVEEGEVLKGALVEIGYGLAYGKTVILIGQHESYEPWCYFSPQVRRAKDITQAIEMIKALENMNKPSIGRVVHGNS